MAAFSKAAASGDDIKGLDGELFSVSWPSLI